MLWVLGEVRVASPLEELVLVLSLASLLSLVVKLLVVMDWLDTDEVAVDILFDGEDQDRIVRQWITGRTSVQNSGLYRTSRHFWQTCASTSRSSWQEKQRKNMVRKGLSCHSSSQGIYLKEENEINAFMCHCTICGVLF